MANNPKHDLSNYEPAMMASLEQIDRYWNRCKPMLKRCVDRAMHGEMTVDDILESIKSGKMYMFIVKSDKWEPPEVKFVLVMELVHYPRYTAMNVVAIAGSNLRMLIKRYWRDVCGWAYMVGIQKIECQVSQSMERMLQSVGFKKCYIHMKQTIGNLDE